MEDVASDIATFANKTLRRELRVTKVGGGNGFIDLVVRQKGAADTFIEYKWYAGDGIIPEKLFIEEFVDRDLFSITDLANLQWRIKGQKLTKTQLTDYLKSDLGKQQINKLLEIPNKADDVKKWFNMDELDDVISDQNIKDFVDSQFTNIFK